jgi:RNA 2',3'-cyclic 3'-phosphodiesterase
VRLFVALDIPASVRENLAGLLRELRRLSSQPRWMRPENLHVTLKFIGEVPPEKLSAIHTALGGVRSGQAVTIDFQGLGFFPDGKHPRVFWAGMDASPNLKTLSSDIAQATEKLGILPEQRPFWPHLTLARFQPPRLPEELLATILENVTREFGSLRASQFQLIESNLKPSGAEYTTLESFPFVVAEA